MHPASRPVQEIHVSMRVTSTSSTPSAFVIELYLFLFLFNPGKHARDIEQ